MWGRPPHHPVAYTIGAEIPVDGGLTAHGGVKSISDAMRPQGVDMPMPMP